MTNFAGVRQDKDVTTFETNRRIAQWNFVICGEFPSSVERACDRSTSRRVIVLVLSLSAGLLVGGAPASGLRVNVSRSMPRGLYRVRLEPSLRRGVLVAVCLPIDVASIGRSHGYIGAGSCPDGSEPLLKRVVALGGDVVTTSDRAVVVNDVELPSSGTTAVDSNGRPLAHQPFGEHVVGPSEVWVFSSSPRSWDSRYFGPVRVEHVIGQATALLTID